MPLFIALLGGFLFSIAIVPFFNLKAYAALLWFPIIVLSIGWISPPVLFAISPRIVLASADAQGATSYKKTLFTFIWFWFWCGCMITAVACGFVEGWFAFLLGASQREVAEVADMFSFPLGLVNRNFIIKPDTGLAEVLGIVMANSYFYALGLTAVYKVVHGFLYRNRVTQLGISNITLDDDDELF